MADLSPELQEKLEELERELEVRLLPSRVMEPCFLAPEIPSGSQCLVALLRGLRTGKRMGGSGLLCFEKL